MFLYYQDKRETCGFPWARTARRAADHAPLLPSHGRYTVSHYETEAHSASAPRAAPLRRRSGAHPYHIEAAAPNEGPPLPATLRRGTARPCSDLAFLRRRSRSNAALAPAMRLSGGSRMALPPIATPAMGGERWASPQRGWQSINLLIPYAGAD